MAAASYFLAADYLFGLRVKYFDQPEANSASPTSPVPLTGDAVRLHRWQVVS
jgi:hypothetical protein